MAEGDYVTSGTFTISSGSGEVSKEVTATGAVATDIVLITPKSTLPKNSTFYKTDTQFQFYVDSVEENKFTVKSNLSNLSEDVSFYFIVFVGAAS